MTPRRAVAIAALMAYGWWATSLRPFSAVAALAVVGAGVVAVGWGATHRRPRGGPIERRGVAVWLVLATLLAGWQLAAFAQQPRSAHPTLSSIANAVFDGHLVQALACTVWLIVAGKLGEQ
jgi:hypothetical protein